jgi:putative membrane protein
MNFVKELLKGILIGIANIIPGVSGGTMAVSVGVYDKMILAITGFRKDFKNSILTLLPYIIGAVAGIGILSFIVKAALSNYPLQTSGLFVGLIIGGIPIITKKVEGKKVGYANIILFLLFFAVVVGMAFLNGNEGSATDITLNAGTMIQLFFVGIIAAATMIIPGVSGSLVLMILGFYSAIVSNISNFIEALINFDIPALIHGCGIFIPFGLGILVGIGLVAKLIELLFAKVPVLTYYAILGLIFGSPIAIIYKAGITTVSIVPIIATIVTFIIGFAITFFLGDEVKD